MNGVNLLGIKELEANQIYELISLAQDIREQPNRYKKALEGIFVANLFFEPSTRTRFSFEMAEKRLGAEVLNFQEEISSRKKGETIYDTLKTLEALGVHGVVLRHSQNGILTDLKDKVNLALINAGIGHEEHPSQCLLDLFTIYQEFGHISGLKVAIVGDIRHSRVARSNYYGLTKLGAKVYFAGPKELNLDEESWVPSEHWHPWDELIGEMDVIMMLRIQHERHETALAMSKEQYHEQYGLTEERSKRMKPEAIIMHPAPVNRDVELASSLVESSRSRIFKQMENGVYMRMAVLLYVLKLTHATPRMAIGGEMDGHFTETGLYAG
jgi:aspartate carbamoyltransferase catalytic subunit